MKTLKISTDFVDDMEGLSDAEKGRLFDAMLRYAATGGAQDLRGNEKITWPKAKKIIDDQRSAYMHQCRVNTDNRAKSTNRHESSRIVTNRDESSKTPENGQKLELVFSAAQRETEREQKRENERERTKEKEREKLPEKDKERISPPLTPPREKWERLLPEPVHDTFREFVAHRAKMKKPMTPRAKELLAMRLAKMTRRPDTQIELLNNAILHGWQSVYWERDNGKKVESDDDYYYEIT